MKGFLDRMEQNKNNPPAHAEADFLFHFTIVKAAGNPFIIDIMKVLGKMIQKAIEETAIEDDLEGRERSMRFHRALYRAICRKETTKAAEVLHQHSADSRSTYKLRYAEHRKAETRRKSSGLES